MTATEQGLTALPEAVRPFARFCKPAIRVTLFAARHDARPRLWSLELTGVNKHSLGADLQAAGLTDKLSLPELREAGGLCLNSATFGLAVLAARTLGQAIWVYYSDGSCQSAFVELQGESISAVEVSDVSTERYDQAALAGVRRLWPEAEWVDDLFDGFYGADSACLSWCIMDRHVLLPIPVRL